MEEKGREIGRGEGGREERPRGEIMSERLKDEGKYKKLHVSKRNNNLQIKFMNEENVELNSLVIPNYRSPGMT